MQPVVDGGGVAAPAVHGQLRPEGDPGVGVAPQVAGQGALDEAGVGALAVDEEELAAVAGGPEGFAFDVGGLAGAAEVPTISRDRLCMSRGTTTRPCLSVQPRSPSTWTPRATGPKWSSRTVAARAHGRLHAPGGLALLLA